MISLQLFHRKCRQQGIASKAFSQNQMNTRLFFQICPASLSPKYKLHEKMMHSVKSALEDADVAILLVDVKDDLEINNQIFVALKLKVAAIVVLNKTDGVHADRVQQAENFFLQQSYCKKVVRISALKEYNIDQLLKAIIELLPEGMPFYNEDEMTDLPTKFFVGELVREKIYELFGDEIPYHTTVLVNEFKEKETLTKIQVDIIVQRETQKGILLGEGGKMIKQLGSLSRVEIENFLNRKVFLELFIKVRPKWRDNEAQLKEYGYY